MRRVEKCDKPKWKSVGHSETEGKRASDKKSKLQRKGGSPWRQRKRRETLSCRCLLWDRQGQAKKKKETEGRRREKWDNGKHKGKKRKEDIEEESEQNTTHKQAIERARLTEKRQRARMRAIDGDCRRARPNDRVRRPLPYEIQHVSKTPLSSVPCTSVLANRSSLNPLPVLQDDNKLDEDADKKIFYYTPKVHMQQQHKQPYISTENPRDICWVGIDVQIV